MVLHSQLESLSVYFDKSLRINNLEDDIPDPEETGEEAEEGAYPLIRPAKLHPILKLFLYLPLSRCPVVPEAAHRRVGHLEPRLHKPAEGDQLGDLPEPPGQSVQARELGLSVREDSQGGLPGLCLHSGAPGPVRLQRGEVPEALAAHCPVLPAHLNCAWCPCLWRLR